jgi:signal transduction histidine kinase/CheY-like chemotaxis protein
VHPDPAPRAFALRLGLCVATLGACAASYVERAGVPLEDVLLPALGTVILFALGAAALSQSLDRGRMAARVLCVDVMGAWLVLGLLPADGLSERVVAATALLVATLVAAVGRRRSASITGALGGLLILSLGSTFLQQNHIATPDLVVLASRALVIVAASAEVAWILSLGREAEEQDRLREQVERVLREREAGSAGMLGFAQSLAQSDGVADVLEALLKHVRQHVDVGVHAAVLEAEGEVHAVWEEAGRLGPGHLADRLQRLREALAESGAACDTGRLEARSMDAAEVPERLAAGTWVVVPVPAGERVAGVLVLADPRKNALSAGSGGGLHDLARRAGEALQRIVRARSEETRRTSLLLRQMREGVLLLGPDGRTLLSNHAAREALGMGQEGDAAPTVIGEIPVADLARTPPGVARRFRSQVARGDAQRPLDLAGTAVGIVDGRRRIGTLVTLRDVTEEEQSRRRLVQAEKMTLVGQTLAGVAHELNNPLAALVGYADLLKHVAVPDALARPVQQMREQAVRATRIVRNLLNFARRRNPQRVAVNVGELVHGTVELFAYEARMNEVAVDVELDASLPTVLADPHALQQVLVNLVQNAIHALATSDRRPRRVVISAHAAGDQLQLSVRDNGPGVPAALRARIFEPFFTTKTGGQGTGLGLALSKGVAREHGGDLLLEQEGGEGATFLLRLPLRAPQAAQHADSASGETVGVPGSILVVDDEASVRETLVAQLGHLGSRVESARDANEAQRMLTHGGYEAVLLDVRMPGASGLDLHREIAASNPTLARRIVFMTGDFVNDGVLDLMRSTGNPYLEKPFTVDEMKKALARAAESGRQTVLTSTS